MKAIVFGMIFFGVSCAALSASQQAEIEQTAGQLAVCQSLARACKADGGAPSDCYGEYDACVKDAGLRE